MKLQYNPNDKDSIISFAKLLIGKSVGLEYKHDIPKLKLSGKDKGRLGKIIEELYFKYKPNPKPEADFKKAGLELKSAGLLKQKRKGNFVAKERLVLNIIDYELVVKQSFDLDFLTGKNAHLLLVFYLYEQGIDIIESIIKLVGDWSYNNTDLEIIRKDWEFIKQKIADGKAHELSEGDTFYLGACTKGATSLTKRKQPYSPILAKQRAYSLKPKYVNHIIANIANKTLGNFGKLIPSAQVAKKLTIEDIVHSKFELYYENTIDEIVTKTKIVINKKAKNFYANLTKAILGIELNQEIEEFEKAEIIVKTVRLKENNLPKEDISFPNFKYEEIVNQEWEEADFKGILEHKFLFVFFKYENKKLVLKKIKFWNMPYLDLIEVEKVWTKTKLIVEKGEIVKEIKTNKKGKEIRYTNFPSKKTSSISHVRPHATNTKDTYPLPIIDKVTKLKQYTKHCFWLNNTYIRDEIYLDNKKITNKKSLMQK